MSSTPPPSESFSDLRDRIRAAVQEGRFDDASTICDEALVWAREHGNDDDLDQAICNRAGILLAQGLGTEALPDLRRILLRSRRAETRFVAAANISKYYDLEHNVEKGLFYARRALEQAEAAEQDDLVATAHNNLANLLVLDSRFPDASEHYRHALGMPDSRLVDRAIVLANLAYCESVLGDLDAAFPHLFQSLRILRRAGAESWERLPRLGLAYAYLEAGRYERSLRHGRRALELAEGAPDASEQVKNALYLLGEAEKLSGNDFAAFSYFSRLQRTFYPDESFVVEVLMTTDIRGLVNLMA